MKVDIELIEQVAERALYTYNSYDQEKIIEDVLKAIAAMDDSDAKNISVMHAAGIAFIAVAVKHWLYWAVDEEESIPASERDGNVFFGVDVGDEWVMLPLPAFVLWLYNNTQQAAMKAASLTGVDKHWKEIFWTMVSQVLTNKNHTLRPDTIEMLLGGITEAAAALMTGKANITIH
ncbi:hypothetical protein E6E07_09350 [Escherichia coli]|nr:hypothetical protein [Escherichia coli]EFN4539154.1 hypothetical protein [Escherichia coli]